MPNADKVRLYGTPPVVTNVRVGTRLLYVGEGEKDFPTRGTCLMPVTTGTVLWIRQKDEWTHNWYYELCQNSDEEMKEKWRRRWVSASKLAEMINNDLLLKIPNTLSH